MNEPTQTNQPPAAESNRALTTLSPAAQRVRTPLAPPPIVGAVKPAFIRWPAARWLALAVAGISDALSLGVGFFPPIQITVDLATALVLFALLGWRWLLLPALIAEAIPGLDLFPSWIAVVLSLMIWGDLRKPGGRLGSAGPKGG